MCESAFTGAEAGSRLAQEEIFGPVLAALRFRTYEEAVEIANSTKYGLTASVFTSELERAHSFARDVEAGFVWVDDSSRHFPGVPFGGVKESEVGREEDATELESYSQQRGHPPARPFMETTYEEWRRVLGMTLDGVFLCSQAAGLTDTEGVRERTSHLFPVVIEEQAVKRAGQPEDIAECVAYLAGPGAGFITGQTIVVNGGTRFV